MRHEQFVTCARGLRQDSLPYRLYQKAKKHGIWDPKSIDFSQDKKDWAELTEEQRRGTLGLIAKFQAGEEAVTLDILPLMMVIAKEGRLEEEMFLTTFLFEEAKHTEFFRLVLNAIGAEGEDLSAIHGLAYRKVFYEILPETMNRLLHDNSPRAVAEASVVYNMFVEGILAETGYWSFYEGLNKAGKMPGLMKGIGYLKTDESRHIGYGTFLLQRLICENPELFEVVANRLRELALLAIEINEEGFAGEQQNPFGVSKEASMKFSMTQLNARIEVLSRAKDKTIDEIYRIPESAVGVL